MRNHIVTSTLPHFSVRKKTEAGKAAERQSRPDAINGLCPKESDVKKEARGLLAGDRIAHSKTLAAFGAAACKHLTAIGG